MMAVYARARCAFSILERSIPSGSLRVDRLLGEKAIARDSEAGRQQFSKLMESRRAHEASEANHPEPDVDCQPVAHGQLDLSVEPAGCARKAAASRQNTLPVFQQPHLLTRPSPKG